MGNLGQRRTSEPSDPARWPDQNVSTALVQSNPQETDVMQARFIALEEMLQSQYGPVR
jgi:hypothetical protein